jgi:hypothetical protein
MYRFIINTLNKQLTYSQHTVGFEGRELSDSCLPRSVHIPTTRGRQPSEVAQSQIAVFLAKESSQPAVERHRQTDCPIDKRNSESVID